MSGGGSVVTVRVASEEVSVYDGGTAGTAHNVYSVSSETRSESLEVGVDMSDGISAGSAQRVSLMMGGGVAVLVSWVRLDGVGVGVIVVMVVGDAGVAVGVAEGSGRGRLLANRFLAMARS